MSSIFPENAVTIFPQAEMRFLAIQLDRRRAELGLSKEQVRVAAGIGKSQMVRAFRGDWDDLQCGVVKRVMDAMNMTEAMLQSEVQDSPAIIEPPAVHSKLDKIIAMLTPSTKPAPLELLPEPGRTIRVPMSKVAAGGGYWQEPRTEPEDWYELPAVAKPKDGDLRALEITGDSMSPELNSGDLVIVFYPTKQPARRLLKHGDLCVVTDDDYTDIIKRFVFDHETGKDMLASTNPDYLPIELPRKARYIGKVQQVIKRG